MLPAARRVGQEQGPHRLDFVGKNVAAITDDPRNKGKPKKEKVDYGEVYVYSGQKFQYTEMQKELLRKKLSEDHRNHYTYGKDYLSLSMAMVNEEELAHTAKMEAQAKFVDPRGFVYPAARTGKECNEHPKKLAEALVEDLKTPWVDPHKKVYDAQQEVRPPQPAAPTLEHAHT